MTDVLGGAGCAILRSSLQRVGHDFFPDSGKFPRAPEWELTAGGVGRPSGAYPFPFRRSLLLAARDAAGGVRHLRNPHMTIFIGPGGKIRYHASGCG